MTHVLFYVSSSDVATKAPAHFAEHKARIDVFHGRGVLVGIGLFADPQRDGAMALFTTRKAAEEFATDDPFVTNGVVESWHIKEWNDIFAVPG